MNKLFLSLTQLIVSFLCATNIYAQNIPGEYIETALSNNLVLKERKVSLQKSLVALQQARSLFLPTTWFEGQYTLAKGGRTIDIPVGDLMNPVYKTLNQLTNSNGFTSIGNVSEQLNPNNFYDVRIRTTMPLYNPDLKINRDIQQQQVQLQQSEVDTYKRALVKEVKTAYYNYLLTGKAIIIYQNALQVVNQNLRMNESLLKNGKGLPAYVSRAESEVNVVRSQLQTAINDQQNARAAFNFLLNRTFTDSIIVVETTLHDSLATRINPGQDGITGREELKSLTLAKEINANQLKMNNGFRKPRLNAFLDLASQGFDFEVNNKSIYYLGGVQLQIPIFAGKRNLYKIKQTALEAQAIDLNTSNTIQQLELAALVSRNNMVTAYNNYQSALKQEEAARQYFKLINKGYTEGVNSFIEFLDARNQLTSSSLQAVINQYKVLSAAADYERQTASYSFK